MAIGNALLFAQEKFTTKRVNGVSGAFFPSHSGRQQSDNQSFEDILQEEKRKLKEDLPPASDDNLLSVNLQKYNGRMIGYSNHAVVAYFLLTEPQTDLRG
ncbi:MAG: hypothetical protein IKL06_08095 [Lachnospiraceae bacterium]|nr:hypothetical protein [Lachnospiraceae bacterium]